LANFVKIALCLEYPINQFGGTEILVKELIKGLADKHQIVLVSRDSAKNAGQSSIGKWLSGHIHWNPASICVAQSRQLAETFAAEKINLAHFHFGGNYAWGNRRFNLSPIVHVCRKGIPTLSTNHGAFSIMAGYCGPQRSALVKLALFLPAWLSKQYVLAHLECEVAVSRYDYRALRRWYPFLRRKFRQIYHSQLHFPPPVGATKRHKVILCVGTVGPRKGQPILVEAFCHLADKHPDWQLVLIGRMDDDLMERQIHESIKHARLSERVQLLGARPDAEVQQWLSTSAIFAMPSFQEGLGLSLQEALFHGCACVASRAGGISDLIDHGENGLLVEPGNVAQLAAALEKMISDDSYRVRLGTHAPQSILDKKMTAEGMVQKYLELYQEIFERV
jgi:glycosyltransferase involved in cell wall biosynthesis